jgi:hypothetical protein
MIPVPCVKYLVDISKEQELIVQEKLWNELMNGRVSITHGPRLRNFEQWLALIQCPFPLTSMVSLRKVPMPQRYSAQKLEPL